MSALMLRQPTTLLRLQLSMLQPRERLFTALCCRVLHSAADHPSAWHGAPPIAVGCSRMLTTRMRPGRLIMHASFTVTVDVSYTSLTAASLLLQSIEHTTKGLEMLRLV